ncbi:MAG: LamG-like jellyroll fold domain-containing protein [Bacteroidota bacterium]
MKYKSLFLTIAIFLGMIAITAAQVPSYVPTNGLVGWYPFAGNSNDLSGNGNHSVVNAALLTTDRFGMANAAYIFNGSTAYLHGNASAFPSGDRTIALWFYTTNINIGLAGMQVFGYGGGLCRRSWLMQMDNSTPLTSIITDNTYEVSVGCNEWITALPFGINGSPVNPNLNWHHWVVTNGPGGLDYYIDGNYAGGITTPIGNTLVSGTKFFIGSCPDSTGLAAHQSAYLNNWNGKLDDIGVWNRKLTQQEISTLFNGGSVGFPDVSQTKPFLVYPNPAQDQINIQVDQNVIGSSVVLYDPLGKVVFSDTIRQTHFPMEMGNLASGSYILHIKDERGYRIKIQKQ